MPPMPLVYNTGDEINLRATVVDGRDVGHPVISIGDHGVSIPQADLDRADHRDDSYREPTQAEKDLAEMAEAMEPTLDHIEPTTAVVGAPDLVLHVFGTGFTEDTQIVWNGTEEETVYVSPSELTTIVKPSLASGPWLIQVGVTGSTETVGFQFTEDTGAAAAAEAAAKAEFSQGMDKAAEVASAEEDDKNRRGRRR